MGGITEKITEFIKDLLTGWITSNLDTMFTDVNTKVETIAAEVGKTPQNWNSGIFSMIKNLSDNVIVPIAGMIITFVLCYELISMIMEKNNMHDTDIKGLSDREVIETVRKQLADYHPQSVRRVFIPKPGSDKKRPLGIPCIWDRLIQQCILQVLEPICEPKFHNHSYGFRQNRDAHHAVSRVVSMVNMYKHYYCVDVDIRHHIFRLKLQRRAVEL